MIPVPTLVRIEYWSPTRADWVVGHASWNLLNPTLYVQKLAKRDPAVIGRAVEIDTGKIHYGPGGELL